MPGNGGSGKYTSVQPNVSIPDAIEKSIEKLEEQLVQARQMLVRIRGAEVIDTAVAAEALLTLASASTQMEEEVIVLLETVVFKPHGRFGPVAEAVLRAQQGRRPLRRVRKWQERTRVDMRSPDTKLVNPVSFCSEDEADLTASNV
jgi:hypothetical protein